MVELDRGRAPSFRRSVHIQVDQESVDVQILLKRWMLTNSSRAKWLVCATNAANLWFCMRKSPV